LSGVPHGDARSDIFAEGGDIINPITIPTTPLGSTGSGAPGAAKTPLASGAPGAFASLFAGKLTAAVTPASGGAASTVDADLARSVKEQLDGGTSLSDVVTRLASSLATSVAAQLGISPQDAQQRLTQAFTQALQPNDTGPPKTNAERASSLVSRLRQIAELATRVTNGETGQPIRLIAGQRSDADEAKAKTAPQPDSILRDALAALAAPASPTLGATAPSAAPVAPATASDGRTVALSDPAQAIAAGGDTPLGRILTRAVVAGEQRSTQTGGTSTAASATSAGASGTAANAAGDGTATVDAFLQAFASALARTDGTAPNANASGANVAATAYDLAATAPAARADDDRTAASPSATGTATPFAIPVANDAAPVAPPVPAATLPYAQPVDANAVVDQMLRGVAIRTTDGQSEVRLRLVPENLGDVSVKLVVSGGSVDASLTAHTAEAQTALAGGAAQLAKTLADAGLKLQSFSVGLAGGFADTRDQSRSHDSGTRSNARRIGGLRSTETDEPDDASLIAAPGIGPSIYSPHRMPWALEYLA
jgi:flagellar hook-length control protein FliK